MRKFTFFFIVAASIVTNPMAAVASEACICGGMSDPLGYAPDAIPTNPRLFITAGTDRSSLSIVKVVGGVSEPVPFHFEDVPEGTGDGWMVPDALLEPMTSYEYVRGGYHQAFTTGPGEDTAPPTFTSAGFNAWAMSGACETHIAATLVASGTSDDSTPQVLWTWRVTVESPAKTIYFPPYGMGYLGRMLTDDRSWDSCLNNFPEAQLGKKYQAKLVAYDWAGNASKEVSTSFEFAEGGGDDDGCGCRVAGTSRSGEAGAFFLGGLALFACRRRRHSVGTCRASHAK